LGIPTSSAFRGGSRAAMRRPTQNPEAATQNTSRAHHTGDRCGCQINAAVFMRLPEAPWQPIVGPFYGIAMLTCGLAAGVTAALAVVRQGERSWLVFLPLLPALFVLFLVVGEFLGPPH